MVVGPDHHVFLPEDKSIISQPRLPGSNPDATSAGLGKSPLCAKHRDIAHHATLRYGGGAKLRQVSTFRDNCSGSGQPALPEYSPPPTIPRLFVAADGSRRILCTANRPPPAAVCCNNAGTPNKSLTAERLLSRPAGCDAAFYDTPKNFWISPSTSTNRSISAVVL